MEVLRGFAPIADENSRILILGSAPSVESLRRSQYYCSLPRKTRKIVMQNAKKHAYFTIY